jgi:3-deoxy-D-manno-octulosonic-acid transferase
MPVRPEGELVWIHVADPARFVLLGDLIDRLKSSRRNLHVLVTFEEELLRDDPHKLPENRADWVLGLRAGQPAQARQFATHWRPDVCLWIGGVLQSNLIAEVAAQGTLMVMADVEESDVQNVRRAWFPGRTTKAVDSFSKIFVRDAATARAVRRHGVDHRKIVVAGPLRIGAMPPPAYEDQLTELVADLAARPVWLAVGAAQDEIEPILLAHRNAIRLSHRLLLVLSLADPDDTAQAKSVMEDMSLRYCDWDNGAPIEDATQVVFSTLPEEIGIWYRVAPLTLLASSLSSDYEGIDPMPAASLGTALLKGPYTRAHNESYSRLAKAGAVETVRDAASLTSALVRLIAPDRAAAMALAGWEIATEGAELTDELVETVSDGLDRRKAQGARA